MASQSLAPKKPTAVEFLQLISGARVSIYVGKYKKLYSLPKDLLCYYSTYFDRCFNGEFREAKEGKLELLADEVEDFEILLEFMLRGNIPLEGIQAKCEAGKTPDLVRKYMHLLEYADKYNMQNGVGELLYGPLKARLANENHILPRDVELVFRVLKKGHKMRELITQAALSQQGPHGKIFRKQEEDIPEYAQEMLAQMRSAIQLNTNKGRWYDPITCLLKPY